MNYIYNGKEITKDELKKLQEQLDVKLILAEDGNYHVLQKLNG
jgi:hypothetical protein